MYAAAGRLPEASARDAAVREAFRASGADEVRESQAVREARAAMRRDLGQGG